MWLIKCDKVPGAIGAQQRRAWLKALHEKILNSGDRLVDDGPGQASMTLISSNELPWKHPYTKSQK